ncbi:MAG: nucleotide exchange factor GrpE [Campylobacterota bacterium]|nr:nucleotide exchange factor GrpE [Campylobacterota bacterium]
MTREELKKDICNIIDNLDDDEIQMLSTDGFALLKEEQSVAEELIKINGEFKKLTKVVQKLEKTNDSELQNIKPYIDMYKFIVNSIDLINEMPSANYINILKFNTQFGSFKTAYITIQNRYKDILQEIDLVPVASVGDEYDPQTQKVVAVSSKYSAHENEIIEVIEQGFIHKGELVKYAQVSVSDKG